jgi:hypothetical protein
VTRPRNRRHWLIVFGLAICLVLGAALLVLRLKFSGEDLGEDISDMLSSQMRGRVHIGAIEWPLGELPTLITGGWLPVELRNVKVWDDNTPQRKLVLDVPLITAELDAHTLIFADHNLFFRNVTIHGGYLRLEETTEPYPLHAYDRTIVTLVSAFYPRMKPGWRAGIFGGSPPPIFDLRDVHIQDLDVEAYFIPDIGKDSSLYGFRLSSEDVTGEASFFADMTDSLLANLYFSVQATGKRTVLRTEVEVRHSDYQETDYVDEFTFESLRVDRLAQLPTGWPHSSLANTLAVSASLVSTEGAQVRLAGELLDYWDRPYDGQWNFTADATNAGGTVARAFPYLGGAINAHVRVTGPFVASPTIHFDLDNVAYSLPPPDDNLAPPVAFLRELSGHIDLVNDQGFLDKTVAELQGEGVSGQIALSATFGVAPLRINAGLQITRPINLRRWLPDGVRDTVGELVTGHLRANGLVDETLEISELDVSTVPGPGRKSARLSYGREGRIWAENEMSLYKLSNLRLIAGQTAVSVNGTLSVDLIERLVVSGTSKDLDFWLQRLGAPELATAAERFTLIASGPWKSPSLRIEDTALSGVPIVGNVEVTAKLSDGAIQVESISSAGLGGNFQGSASIDIEGPPRLNSLALEGRNLDLEKIPGLGETAKGHIRSAKFTAKGPLTGKSDLAGWLAMASGYVTTDTVEILGESFENSAVCVNYKDDALCRQPGAQVRDSDLDACAAAKKTGGVCVVGRGAHVDGGRVDVTVATPRPGRGKPPVAGTLSVQDLPLDLVHRLAAGGSTPSAGGLFSTVLHLGGTRAAITAEGSLSLVRAWLLGAFAGDAELAVSSEDASRIRIVGTAMQGRIAIDAEVGTVAPYPVTLKVKGRRIELDTFVNLAELIGIDDRVLAWASGEITIETDILGDKPPVAWAVLEELSATIEHTDGEGRVIPLRVTSTNLGVPSVPRTSGSACGRNADPAALVDDSEHPISVRITPESVEFVCRTNDGVTPCPIHLATPAGVITIAGAARPGELDISAEGVLDVALLAPFAESYFDETQGTARLSAHMRGTMDKPEVGATLDMEDLCMQVRGQETVVRVSGGQLRLSNGNLGLSDVKILFDDQAQRSELNVHGTIKLDGFAPAAWGVYLEGQIAGKMLLAVAPQVFSQASGVATIDQSLTLTGKGVMPHIDGAILFNRRQPLSFVLRDLRREFSFRDGSVAIACGTATAPCTADLVAHTIELATLEGSINGEGSFEITRGGATISNGALTDIDVSFNVTEIPFRIPRTLDLVISGTDLRITHADGWRLEGKVSVVNGRYKRDLRYDELLVEATLPTAPTKQFWEEEGNQELGSAALDLTVNVDRFVVDNNTASIDLKGVVHVGGTPKRPLLLGGIAVTRGEFRIPGTRARFTRTRGNITFEEKQFPDQDPTLEVTSQADFRDSLGKDHLITLVVNGPLGRLTWDLSTNTGLDKAQALSLALTGKTTEQLRSGLSDTKVGSSLDHDAAKNAGESTTNLVVKDALGDTIRSIVGTHFKDFSGLDVANFFIGVSSVGFHGEKALMENLNVIGDYDQSTRGRTFNVRGELKLPTKLAPSVQGSYLDKTSTDETDETVRDFQLKLVYRFFIP